MPRGLKMIKRPKRCMYSIQHTMYPVPITSMSGYYHTSCGMSRHIVHVLVVNGYGVVIMSGAIHDTSSCCNLPSGGMGLWICKQHREFPLQQAPARGTKRLEGGSRATLAGFGCVPQFLGVVVVFHNQCQNRRSYRCNVVVASQ